MKEDIITFETAVLAKEKGFEYANKVYMGEGKHEGKLGGSTDCNIYYPAPTQSLLQKWLRKKHDIHCLITPYHDGLISYNYEILQPSNDLFLAPRNIFFNYDEALETGLIEALKLIK